VTVTGVIANHKGDKFMHVLYVLWIITGMIKTIHCILFYVEVSVVKTVSGPGHNN
jgi:hypothetical protein